MLVPVNAWEELVTARLLEFFDFRTLWHRSLWNPGIVLMLKEVLEASEAVRLGVLSEEALKLASSSAMRVAAADPGVGERTVLATLNGPLSGKLRYNGLDYRALKLLCEAIERDYLAVWSRHLEQVNAEGKPERIARAIAAHLLDLGFSSDYLHRWWTYQVQHDVNPSSLAAIVSRAHELAAEGERMFDVLVAFEVMTPERFGRPHGWLTSQDVVAWLREAGFDTTGVRQDGGMVLRVSARDPGAAADKAVDIIESLASRSRIASGHELRTFPLLWVRGEARSYPIRDRHRGVNVRALVREHVVFERISDEDGINAAFEMLAPLQRGSAVAAIAGGWAAIEALLSEPNDRGVAAERLAVLVACSFPRAELTQLSYDLERTDVPLRAALAGVNDNRTRAEVVARALTTNAAVATWGAATDAAVVRMRNLIARPEAGLEDVHGHASLAFRRIYRQRNLVLHGGKTDAVALRACLRTAAPLVGAGMDRIAHAYYVQRVQPLTLAAKGRIAMNAVGSTRGPSLVDLLA